MKNHKFKKIVPNYKKKVFDIVLEYRKKTKRYQLPFWVFHGIEIGVKNRVAKLSIDRDLASMSVSFVLEDGSDGDFPSDYVLYYCDPKYDWSPMAQLKKAIKEGVHKSGISWRVMADALQTSPTQVMRLLNTQTTPRQLSQLVQLASLAGYTIELQLKKKAA